MGRMGWGLNANAVQPLPRTRTKTRRFAGIFPRNFRVSAGSIVIIVTAPERPDDRRYLLPVVSFIGYWSCPSLGRNCIDL